MCERLSEASSCASRSKRANRSGSVANVSGSTLTATSRCSRVSRARYTSPIPPAPMAATISYGPRRAPGPSGISLWKCEDFRWIWSVRHHVDEHIHGDLIAFDGEPIEVSRILTLTLPRIAHVGVVRHQHHEPAVAVGDPACVDLRAVGAALRRATAAAAPVADTG